MIYSHGEFSKPISIYWRAVAMIRKRFQKVSKTRESVIPVKDFVKPACQSWIVGRSSKQASINGPFLFDFWQMGIPMDCGSHPTSWVTLVMNLSSYGCSCYNRGNTYWIVQQLGEFNIGSVSTAQFIKQSAQLVGILAKNRVSWD